MNAGIIEKLWEESTKSSWPRPGKFTAGEYDYNLQKFAELIAKECIGICLDNHYMTGDGYAELIREYFGVEP